MVVAGREVAAAAAPTAPPAARVEETELLPAEALAPFGSGTPLLIVPYGLDGYLPKQLYSYCASWSLEACKFMKVVSSHQPSSRLPHSGKLMPRGTVLWFRLELRSAVSPDLAMKLLT